jgi:alcohol dehydrogenase class IV
MTTETTIFRTVPRVLSGLDAIRNLGEEARGSGGKRIAVITDPGVVKAGVHEPAIESLKKARLKHCIFQGVEPDPPVKVVSDCTAFVKENNVNLIVGLGGGSSIDVAKATALMVTNPGSIQDYAGIDIVPKPGLPTILIPTTVGTGSEGTRVLVLSDTKNEVKIAVLSDHMLARVAILDPGLTLGLPPDVTASTGLDALIHAIESYTGRLSTLVTESLAISAIELVARYLRKAYADGTDIEARSGMLTASYMAGVAFTNSQCAAAHAGSMSIGGSFHIPHGIATALMLPAVMKFNCIAAPEKFSRIAQIFGESVDGLSPMEAAERSVKAVHRLITDLGIKMGLENYGVPRSVLPDLAKKAAGMARLWVNNPRSATLEEVEKLFIDSFTDQG